MTTMIAEVYDALIDAGASEDKARKASEAIAGYESQFSRVDRDLAVLKWMVGALYPLVLAILLKLFLH